MPTADQIRWLERPRECGCKHSNPWACRELKLQHAKYTKGADVAEAQECPCACHRLPKED